MAKKGYKPAKEYDGGEVPEGYIVAKTKKLVDGVEKEVQILRKAPKSGKARKSHVFYDENGKRHKTQKQMKNFYESIGIPATTKGRPRKNGLWITPDNPTAGGRLRKYQTPNDMSYAFDCALSKMQTKEALFTKTAVLLEMGITSLTFKEYEKRPEYAEICARINDTCELFLQGEALTERNPNAISMIKMYHDKAEKQSIEVSAKSPVDEMSEQELRELAETAIEDNKMGNIIDSNVIDIDG